MDFLSHITLHPALVLVAPALIILGYVLKQTPKCQDWMIIWVLLVTGIISGIAAIGPDLDGVANGVIAAGMAITSHQAWKQTTERNNKEPYYPHGWWGFFVFLENKLNNTLITY